MGAEKMGQRKGRVKIEEEESKLMERRDEVQKKVRRTMEAQKIGEEWKKKKKEERGEIVVNAKGKKGKGERNKKR